MATTTAASTKTDTRFDWADPLLLDRQLTDDERLVARHGARLLPRSKLAPRVLEMFRHEKPEPAIFREMGALDMLGIVIPEQYGGAGMGYVSYGLVAREVERVDSGFRSMMSVQGSLVMVPINEFGTEAQKQKFLPKLATGEWIGCFGLTEPNFGSDPGGMITRAKKVDGGYALTGTKAWISQQPDRRRVHRLGQGRRRQDPRLHPREGHEGAERAADARQGRAAHQHHRRGGDGERVLPGGERLPRGARAEGAVHLPEQRPLRHRLGRARRRRGLLVPRPPVRARPQAVRPAAGRQSADPEEARRHADRDHARPAGACCGSAG